MRIAYLGSKGLPSKSGTERVVEGIVSRLSGRHVITVYCDARYTPNGTKVDGVRLIRIPTIKGKHIQPVTLFFLSALHALFSRYDVIHLHGTDACFTLPLLRMRYRVVSTVHGTPGRIMRAKWSRLARFFIRMMELPFIYLSNCRTSVSRLDAEFLEARYKREVLYIPNGVDDNARVDLSSADRKLIEAGLHPGHYLLFAAGRIDPSKGCHLVLEALNHLEKPLKLGIVGDLNQVPSYSAQLRQMADPDRVVFFDPVSDQALLFGMVKQARLFVFPSISEGMSMMLLEAASVGVPIVCSDIPENKSVMQDNVLCFNSGDAFDLADRIRWALDHRDEMAELARRARTHVMAAYSWRQIAAQYEQIYKTCGKAG
jgi:glycosyltransferase involved in cell wall biosynthesis